MRPNKPALTSVLVLSVLAGSSLSAEEFLEDDFDFYLDDLEVQTAGWEFRDVNTPVENATWTIVNPGGRASPATANGEASTGKFLISDSDAAGGDNPTCSGMSHDLWSPEFGTRGRTTIWLHFNSVAQLNNNGKCAFDVDVTTDGGATWTNVFRRVAPSRVECEPVASTTNAGGVFGRVHVDISAIAADKDEVRIRWRHFEPNDDWWIAIDDVLVDDQPPPAGGQVTVLPVQGFTGGIPATWTISSTVVPPNEGAQTWTGTDPCGKSITGKTFPIFDGRGVHRLGDRFAIVDLACQNGQKDEYLITPVIDCTNCTKVYLHLKSEIVALVNGVQEILMSVDGGQTFEAPPIFSYNLGAGFDSAEEPFYSEFVFEVPGAARESELAFAFHYLASGNAGYWAIDDVQVSADGAIDPTRCENRAFKVVFDPATGKASGTWKSFAGDEGFRILQGTRQIGPDLGPAAASFTDDAPPAGGRAAYKLQVLAGGQTARECVSDEVQVYACPQRLTGRTDAAAGTVRLAWEKGANLGADLEVRRNDVRIATLQPSAAGYDDAPGAGEWDYEIVAVPRAGFPADQCPAPLFFRAFIPGNDVIHFDDFESYATNDDLEAAGWVRREENMPAENAAWTVTNPGGRANPPTFDGIPSNGRFVISDSDAASGQNPTCSGMSHDLWSPSFSGVGKKSVWLHVDVSAQLNNNGVCSFDVDVSNDLGQSWVNVFRQVAPARLACEPLVTPENADGFFGRLHVDITTWAKDQVDVIVRFRHFEPNDDWWIAIDNFLIDSRPATGGPEVLLEEGFEDGIPDDWIISSGAAGLGPWNTDDNCAISLFKATGNVFPDGADGRKMHRLGERFAIIDPVCSGTGADEYLEMPILDCSGLDEVFLEVSSEILPKDNTIAEILLSTDGGLTFDPRPVFSYNRGAAYDEEEDPLFNRHFLPVPRAAGHREVVFTFHYRADPGNGRWWGIDDVKVSGRKAAPPSGFVRGDCNGDLIADISDAVANLDYLFLGGQKPPCEEACNANDDATNDISDAVALLGFLFLGEPPPPAPGPTVCGPDPVPGPLTCETPSC